MLRTESKLRFRASPRLRIELPLVSTGRQFFYFAAHVALASAHAHDVFASHCALSVIVAQLVGVTSGVQPAIGSIGDIATSRYAVDQNIFIVHLQNLLTHGKRVSASSLRYGIESTTLIGSLGPFFTLLIFVNHSVGMRASAGNSSPKKS